VLEAGITGGKRGYRCKEPNLSEDDLYEKGRNGKVLVMKRQIRKGGLQLKEKKTCSLIRRNR